MKAVTQEDAMGCGIACVAFVIGRSYRTTQHNYFRERKPSTKGYYCFELTRALSRAGLKYSYKRVKGNLNAKEGSIVFIEKGGRYPGGHYLVKVKSGWMNPWINFPDIRKPRSGFTKSLPDRPEWVIFKVDT